jgi:uncharacterized protein (TIGR00251 family)
MRIQVKVTPNSKVEEVSQKEDKFLVRVKEPPKEGKANRAVIRLLANYFKVPQHSIRVVSGLGNRNKVIEILGK